MNQDESQEDTTPKKTIQFVYLLVSSFGSTYVGATMDLNRRLRQHNKEIVGGARATGSKVARGETWRRHCYVSGFPDWAAALQFEWRWKQISRKIQSVAPRSSRMSPVERRMLALNELLAMERPTSKALAYAEWESPPEVHMEM
jgi:structure-specific endonuclease subunit SLX1